MFWKQTLFHIASRCSNGDVHEVEMTTQGRKSILR